MSAACMLVAILASSPMYRCSDCLSSVSAVILELRSKRITTTHCTAGCPCTHSTNRSLCCAAYADYGSRSTAGCFDDIRPLAAVFARCFRLPRSKHRRVLRRSPTTCSTSSSLFPITSVKAPPGASPSADYLQHFKLFFPITSVDAPPGASQAADYLQHPKLDSSDYFGRCSAGCFAGRRLPAVADVRCPTICVKVDPQGHRSIRVDLRAAADRDDNLSTAGSLCRYAKA